MTRVRPVSVVALALAQGRRVDLVFERGKAAPRARRWSARRVMVLVVAMVTVCAGGCWV